MLFAVIFTDNPDHSALRSKFLQAHIDWVAKHEANVLVAGSLREEPQQGPKGGLWVVEASSKEAVFELMKSDPFYACGLRRNYEVLYWNKALERKVMV